MADVKRETNLITLLKQNRQREALDYLYDAFDGNDLQALSQLGTRLTAMADTVSIKKSKEREARRRKLGSGRGTEGQDFISV